MNKEDLKSYLKPFTVKFENFQVTVRGLKTAEYIQLAKAQKSGDEMELYKFFDGAMENIIIQHSVEGTSKKDVGQIILEDWENFKKFVGDYMDFLFPKNKK